MKKTFEKICRMPQEQLKVYAANRLRETHRTVIMEDGFVYAQGVYPVLLVAHMDTVHKKLPNNIIHKGNKISSPNGIGGDDRCGVFMILEIIKKYNCSVLFCEDEEIGCVGAEKFTRTNLAESLKGQFNYIVEFDRRGENDAVFYECDNPDFEEFVTREFFKTAWGSFSDISTVAPFLKCAAVNLSCGYYNAHTKDEYVMWNEMETVIKEAMKLLERTEDRDKFEYIEAVGYYSRYGNYYDSPYADDYGAGYYMFEIDTLKEDYEYFDTYANSLEEAVGYFCTTYPNKCFNDIADVFYEPDDIWK